MLINCTIKHFLLSNTLRDHLVGSMVRCFEVMKKSFDIVTEMNSYIGQLKEVVRK
jgi:hypothetical protein